MLNNPPSITLLQATGCNQEHLDTQSCQRPLHIQVIKPWQALQAAAQQAGLSIQIASGYRSFQQQLTIWNEKAQGLRPVLNAEGEPIAIAALTDEAAVFAILKWSALPGASRHHFGTDIDIYAPQLLPQGYRLQLTQHEAQSLQKPLHDWLDAYLIQAQPGFFRPYAQQSQGVASEPWHLSYGPVAQIYQQVLTEAALAQLINATDIAYKGAILHHLNVIYRQYVTVPWSCYPASTLNLSKID